MAGHRRLVCLTHSIFLFLTILLLGGANAMKGGYWPADSESYSPVSQIKTSLFTHLYYAFAGMDSSTSQLTLPPEYQSTVSSFSSTLKSSNPAIKTMLSIGGGSAKKEDYAAMAADSAKRSAFISSSIAMARKYSFDGLDLDWEYPLDSTQMSAFADLIKEWRDAANADAASSGKERLLLSAAVYYAPRIPWESDRTYPVSVIKQSLDWVNAMAYDFHGEWEKNTGAPAALYDPKNPDVSGSAGVKSWLDAGLPGDMVALGIPLYGHSWTLADANDASIGAPATGAGSVGADVSYSDIKKFIADNRITEVFDAATVSAYCHSGVTWIGYDNVESMTKKVDFVKNQGIVGYFLWNVAQDDSDRSLMSAASNTMGA